MYDSYIAALGQAKWPFGKSYTKCFAPNNSIFKLIICSPHCSSSVHATFVDVLTNLTARDQHAHIFLKTSGFETVSAILGKTDQYLLSYMH